MEHIIIVVFIFVVETMNPFNIEMYAFQLGEFFRMIFLIIISNIVFPYKSLIVKTGTAPLTFFSSSIFTIFVLFILLNFCQYRLL